MTSFSIRSAVLAPIFELTQTLGANPNRVIQRAGLNSAIFQDPDVLISHTDALKLFDATVAETHCEHVGLLIGERINIQDLGLLGLLMRSSPTFGVALKNMIKHLAIHAQGITRELHADNRIAYITTGFDEPLLSQSFPAVQMSVATNWRIAQLLSHHQCHPTAIHFTFSEPENSIFFRRFFKAPVVFDGDFNGIVFHAADLELPIREHDPILNQEMERQIGKLKDTFSDKFIDDVKRLIRQNMNAGICNIDAVISFFPFEKRTFQTKLKDEGVSYQALVDNIRFQRAEHHLLNSNISVSQLADLLCYKSSSVFSTAFKNKYGLSPSKWRVKTRENHTVN